MDVKQNPFSFYDFLGYFTPGAMFIYACMAGYAYMYGGVSAITFVSSELSFNHSEIYIPFVLLAYTVGHVLSYLSSVVIEKYSIWILGYPSKYLLNIEPGKYFQAEEHTCLRRMVRGFVAIMVLPISSIDFILGKTFRDLYTKPLDPLLVDVIFAKLLGLLREHSGLEAPPEDAKAHNTDFFRYVYHYTVEHAPNHLPKMQNYVALYGFLRTLTFLSVMLFWGLFVHMFSGKSGDVESVTLVSVAWLMVMVFYMAFVKFYRRFSLEALMALVASYTPKAALAKGDGDTGISDK